MIDIRLLGTLDVRGPDGESRLSILAQPKRFAVLSYLTLEALGTYVSRDRLLRLFWPESDELRARNALRQTLHWLRKGLGADVILARGPHEIGLNAGDLRCDARVFAQAVAAGRNEEALDLYAGDLLEDLRLDGAHEFEAWVARERRRLRELAAGAAWTVARQRLAERRLRDAKRAARRATDLSGVAEGEVRGFIEALAAAGDRAGAVRFYEAFAESLARDLELQPASETRELAEDIRASMGPGASGEAHGGAPEDRDSGGVDAPDSASPGIRGLAVLPLRNLMNDPAQEYFVDGMQEALTVELSKVGALKVISRTSTMRYRDTEKSMPQIARELGVEGLVEGSVLRGDDQVRISVRLIDGISDRHLWANSYERELRGVLALQREVARAIAVQIRARLTPADETRLADAPPVDPAAYEEYLRGLNEWHKFTVAGWQAAIGHFQRSVEQAPSYAPAYAMMSSAYSWLGNYASIPPTLLQSGGLTAAERAVELDPGLAEAHASLALVKATYDWDWAVADTASQEGLRLNPGSALALLVRGLFLSFVGRHDEAVSVARRAADLDPMAPYPNTWLGWICFVARRYDDSIAQAKKVLALEPGYPNAHVVMMWAYGMKGMFDEALAARRHHSELVPEETRGPPGWWGDAWILGLAGRKSEARAMLDQVPDNEAARPMAAFILAMCHGALGDKDRAFELLEIAYEGRTGRISLLNVDPRFDGLRDDPRFDELLRRMGFPG